MAAACPRLWPPEVHAALDVTEDRVEVATIVASVPAATAKYCSGWSPKNAKIWCQLAAEQSQHTLHIKL